MHSFRTKENENRYYSIWKMAVIVVCKSPVFAAKIHQTVSPLMIYYVSRWQLVGVLFL